MSDRSIAAWIFTGPRGPHQATICNTLTNLILRHGLTIKFECVDCWTGYSYDFDIWCALFGMTMVMAVRLRTNEETSRC